MKYEVNALGKQCPIPVVMTKKVIDQSGTGDEIEILVDNETGKYNRLYLCVRKTGGKKIQGKNGGSDRTDRHRSEGRGVCL